MDDRNPTGISPEQIAPAAPGIVVIDPPPRSLEFLGLFGIVALADLAIYRGGGYAGWAAVLAAAPVLLFIGAAHRRPRPSAFLLGAMLVLLAARLVWCGSVIETAVGLAVLPCFAIAVAGFVPYLSDSLIFTLQIVYHGGRGVAAYGRGLLQFGRRFAPATAIAIVVPLVIGAAFSLLFVLANPDLVRSVSETLSQWFEQIRKWLIEFSPDECVFLFVTAWITVALLRARVGAEPVPREVADTAVSRSALLADVAPRPLYLAWRNSLIVVTVIYGLYLVFEFHTLWFREFPQGFYYSGYAHEGAAWLTIALALATSILSLIFRGRILNDQRVIGLQRLAWLWSAENLLLAAAVYNRLLIYVGFNGMTRMRILGFYGVSAVVVGFLLVVVKIIRRHNFAWLLQRHLWTLGIATYLYALTPLDYLAMRYNVSRILAGHLAPAVQISEQPISNEGLLVLWSLLACPDPEVKDGVAALLEERADQLRTHRARTADWTAYQAADELFLVQIRNRSTSPPRFTNEQARSDAWKRFAAYAYQWY
jgi:hypothetical protein